MGLTRDAGWQAGVSRAVPVDLATAWAHLTAPDGLAVWLGDGAAPEPEVGAAYTADDGTRSEWRRWRRRSGLREGAGAVSHHTSRQ